MAILNHTHENASKTDIVGQNESVVDELFVGHSSGHVVEWISLTENFVTRLVDYSRIQRVERDKISNFSSLLQKTMY